MKTVVEMAREAGFTIATGFDVDPGTAISIPMGSWGVEEVERFAELVRAEEREALKNIDWTALMREGNLVTWGNASELGDRVIAAIEAQGELK